MPTATRLCQKILKQRQYLVTFYFIPANILKSSYIWSLDSKVFLQQRSWATSHVLLLNILNVPMIHYEHAISFPIEDFTYWPHFSITKSAFFINTSQSLIWHWPQELQKLCRHGWPSGSNALHQKRTGQTSRNKWHTFILLCMCLSIISLWSPNFCHHP